jgi:hypothetical protein
MPTVASWLEYLEHLSSSSQNYMMGFVSVIIASLAIISTIIIANNENSSFNLLGKAIFAGIVTIAAIFIWWAFLRGSYGINVLVGKSARKLVDDYFSGHHNELYTSQGIQNKWNDIQTRIMPISDDSRRSRGRRKTLIKNEDSFRVWYYNL